ncbi:MAG: protein-L-isoaspartate(D-aspartate) O-methyltransferase [Candidatus Micrarchaeaceae archaeon]
MQSNEEMVAALLKQGYASERIAKAMLKFDRKYFLTEETRGSAYEDRPLPILGNQTTSAPSVIAYMLKNLDIRYGMRVLEIGTGSGYQTALASVLAGARGKVFTIERSKELYYFAKANLKRYKLKNIVQILGNGAKGYAKEAPYDRIIYSAAARSVPRETLQQLKKDGSLIAPVGSFTQELLLVRKHNGVEYKQDMGPVIFSRLEEE